MREPQELGEQEAPKSRIVSLLVKLRINALIEEGSKHAFSDPVRLQEIAQKLHQLSEQHANQRGLIYSEYFWARVLFKHSEFGQALPRYVLALESFEDMGDRRGVRNCLRQLGLTCRELSKYEQSIQYFERELELRQRAFSTDVAGIAGVIVNIAVVYLVIGQHDAALERFLKALTLLEEDPDDYVLSGTLANVANLYMSLANYEEAMTYLQRVLLICQNRGDKVVEASTLLNIGWNYLQCQQYEQALQYNSLALRAFQELGDRKHKAIALLNIGRIHTQLKNYEQALAFFQKSSEIFLTIEDKRNYASLLRAMGYMYNAMSQVARAEEFYSRSLVIVREIGERQVEYELYELLAEVVEQQGDTERSLYYYREYMRVKEEVLDERRLQAISEMQIRFNVEQAEKEKEIYHLKNIELASALEEVELLNKHLSEANNEKNELLGIVAHDLKNPIAGLSISLSLVQTHFAKMSQGEILHQMGVMTKIANRMQQIVTKLLDINILDSGKLTFEPVLLNFNEVIQTVVDDYGNRAREKDINICCTLASDELPIYVDKSAMLEVLDNLVSNAIKYSPYHSVVTICSFAEEKTVQCEVQDSGPGIAPENFDKLFKKYTRLDAKPTGGESSTGLGLSIVKKLVDAMNGCVWCKEGVEQGACFVLQLPKKTME